MTKKTYTLHAQKYLEKFSKLGTRSDDIREVFSYTNYLSPIVVELGCAGGRDAEEILHYTKNYTGIDYVVDFIEAARTKLPSATFIQSDIENYIFKEKVQIVFAFASLLHLPKESLKKIFEEVSKSLYVGGLFRISLKWKPSYEMGEEADAYGKRTFYYYDEETIRSISCDFEIIF